MMRFFSITLCFSIFLLGCTSDDDNSCSPVKNINIIDIESTFVTVDYELRDVVNYEIEHGISGFLLGTGSSQIVDANFAAMIVDLQPNTDYELYIRAICDANNKSVYSNVFPFTTTIDEEKTSCFPPVNITSNVIDYNEVLVSWDSNSATDLSYEIEYDLTGFELGTGIQKPAFDTELLLDALIVGTSYDYYLRTICEEEVSEFSGPFTFTTRACVLPSEFIISEILTTSALASWEGNGEVSWELEYGVEGFELGDGEVIFLGETEVVLEDLIPMTTYEVYLRANCGPNGRSDYLDVVSFTTL